LSCQTLEIAVIFQTFCNDHCAVIFPDALVSSHDGGGFSTPLLSSAALHSGVSLLIGSTKSKLKAVVCRIGT